MNYTRLSHENRIQIETLIKLGKSIRSIATILGCAPSTVSRELKRIQGNYCANDAQTDSKKKNLKRYKDPNIKYKDQIEYICNNHNKTTKSIRVVAFAFQKWFPTKPKMSWQQLYKVINNNKIQLKPNNLTYKKRNKKFKNSMMNHIKHILDFKTVLPISLRPSKIEQRNEIGHLEIDSIVGLRDQSEKIISIVDRTTRMIHLIKAEYSYDHYVNNLIHKYIVDNKIETKSITTDNGLEFSALGICAKRLGVKLYKCDPYCSFQRGSNERMNAIVRRFIPKGISIRNVTNAKLYSIEREINSMPRQIFNFKSPYEMYIMKRNEVLR